MHAEALRDAGPGPAQGPPKLEVEVISAVGAHIWQSFAPTPLSPCPPRHGPPAGGSPRGETSARHRGDAGKGKQQCNKQFDEEEDFLAEYYTPAHDAPSCGHVKHWKRLRAKRGFAYFVCYQCGLKWRMCSIGVRAPDELPGQLAALPPRAHQDHLGCHQTTAQ
eukprot:EG_transcript_8092